MIDDTSQEFIKRHIGPSKTDQNKILEYIFINEGQFFDNLVEFCNIYASLGKEIYVCGLDGDYLKRPFGEILNLIPHCDTVTKLSAECSCGRPANFTKKIKSTPNLIYIGSHETYSPVCRKCYDN